MRRVSLLWAGLAVLWVSGPAFAQSSRQSTAALDTANECVALPVGGMGTGAVQVTNISAATITWTVSVDGVTWVAIDAFTPDAPGTAVNSTAGNGVWTMPVAGLQTMRACVGASGSATVRLSAAATGGGGGGGGGGTFEGEVTVAAQPADDPHFVQCSDGLVAAACVVSGTVTANLGATDNAVLDDIADGIPVTNAGTFVTQENGAALTALQLIDNAISGAGFNITQLAGATTPMTTTQADGLAYTLDGLNTTSFMYIDNGVTFDKWDGAVTISGTPTVDVSSVPSNMSVNLSQYLGATLSETNPVAVRISNGTTFPTLASDSTFGTTTYTEASSTGPVVGAIRNDTLEALANTNNEAAPLQVDALGLLYSRMQDPCSGVAKTYIPINISTATTTELTPNLAGASTHYYICSLHLVTAAANNVALADDNTDNCASVTAGLAGGVTAASGWNFAANGGIALNGGNASVMRTVTTNAVLCLVTSAATQLSGQIVVVAAP